jgi:hypothetical protein
MRFIRKFRKNPLKAEVAVPGIGRAHRGELGAGSRFQYLVPIEGILDGARSNFQKFAVIQVFIPP